MTDENAGESCRKAGEETIALVRIYRLRSSPDFLSLALLLSSSLYSSLSYCKLVASSTALTLSAVYSFGHLFARLFVSFNLRLGYVDCKALDLSGDMGKGRVGGDELSELGTLSMIVGFTWKNGSGRSQPRQRYAPPPKQGKRGSGWEGLASSLHHSMVSFGLYISRKKLNIQQATTDTHSSTHREKTWARSRRTVHRALRSLTQQAHPSPGYI